MKVKQTVMKQEISQRRSSNNKNLDSSLYHFFERIIFQVYADFSENVFFHTTNSLSKFILISIKKQTSYFQNFQNENSNYRGKPNISASENIT